MPFSSTFPMASKRIAGFPVAMNATSTLRSILAEHER